MLEQNRGVTRYKGFNPFGLLILFVSVVSTLAGCTFHHGLLDKKTEEAVSTIKSTDFKELSITPITTLEEASKKIDTTQDIDEAYQSLIAKETEAATLAVSLEDVRQLTLSNNLDLQTVLVDPYISQEQVREEEARFEWTFTGSSAFSVSDQPLSTETDAWQNEVGIDIPLRTGGFTSISLPYNYTDVSGSPSIQDSGFQVSFSQPLLRNAGVYVNTAPIEIARLQARQVDARTKLSAIRILADAERTYWNYYIAEKILEIQKQQYDIALQQLKSAELLVQQGVAPPVEILRSKSGLARRVDEIITAETQRRIAERALKRTLNEKQLDLTSKTVLFTDSSPNPVHFALNRDELADKAVENRMEMLQLELQLAIDAITVNVAENQKLPSFAFDFQYSNLGAGRNFDAVYDSFFDSDFGGLSARASFSIPIGNAARKARFRQAVLQRVSTLASQEAQELSIREETLNALDQLYENWEKILAAQKEVELANSIYQAEKREFNNNFRTSTEVLEAASFLADAQSNEVRALASYEIAKIELAFATGTLLGYGRVEIPPYDLSRFIDEADEEGFVNQYQTQPVSRGLLPSE